MKSFLRETYSYAILLVILFGIASIAVIQTLSYLHSHLDGSEYKIVAVLIWTLTMGFMLIAGAFGLWATQFSAQAESRRRIGRMVDAMDYIHDGLLAADHKGRITGLNPAARQMSLTLEPRPSLIRNAFPCLSDSDTEQLIRAREPMEVERPHSCRGLTCTLRFRSQPSDGVTLLLISDVSALDAQRRHNRQVARLQLIGQIARGVAHDFNNILCVISGNASLLQRQSSGSRDAATFFHAISQSVERGSAMATHLLELSRTVTTVDANVEENEPLYVAVNAFKNSLPPNWNVNSKIERFGAVSLSEVQLEQVVLNVGLHVTESSAGPGVVYVYGGPPSKAYSILAVDDKYSGVVLISANDIEQILQAGVDLQQRELNESGVILSVVRTLIEEEGGAMHCLTASPGILVYRVLLPRATGMSSRRPVERDDVPDELTSLVSDWKLLYARAPGRAGPGDHAMDRLGLSYKSVESVSAVLSEISDTVVFHVLFIDRELLVKEGHGILRAVLRLMPTTGIVVLGEDLGVLLGDFAAAVIAVQPPLIPKAILVAMIESHSLAAQRKQAGS